MCPSAPTDSSPRAGSRPTWNPRAGGAHCSRTHAGHLGRRRRAVQPARRSAPRPPGLAACCAATARISGTQGAHHVVAAVLGAECAASGGARKRRARACVREVSSAVLRRRGVCAADNTSHDALCFRLHA
eukprot:1697874-Prymnesium_polylepis.1